MAASAPERATGGSAADGPSQGGTALVALVQEPGSFNLHHSTQSGAFLNVLAVEPLFSLREDGTYEPFLAAEVPTVENGGLSEDGRTVTYRLREGITWSDGEPFTADDLVFTWQALTNPESDVDPPPAFWAIESVEAVDEVTAVVTMHDPHPGFLAMWRDVLPAHLHDSTVLGPDDPDAAMPLGTGPFVFDSWQRGDSVILLRNDSYWRDPAQPYLDGVTLKIVPDAQTALSSFLNGEYDTVYFLTSGDLPAVAGASAAGAPIELSLQERLGSVEWLWLNHTAGADPAEPHPVLADPAVREAIDLAIDRQTIIDTVLEGNGSLVGNSLIYVGRFAVNAPPTGFDPGRARDLLDDAGWVDSGDGVRERDGVRASLRFTTVSGDQMRDLYQQLIQQNLADIGIEVTIENAPSDLLFGSFVDGGLIATGDFDIAMSREGEYPDPTDFAYLDYFTCAWVPGPDNPDAWAYTRWCNEQFDERVHAAAATLDDAERARLYEAAVAIWLADRPALALYASVNGSAWNTRLGGVERTGFDGIWFAGGPGQWYAAG